MADNCIIYPNYDSRNLVKESGGIPDHGELDQLEFYCFVRSAQVVNFNFQSRLAFLYAVTDNHSVGFCC